MPEQEEIPSRLSLFHQRVFAGRRQSLPGDGAMSYHDSLNLRKEVISPINYEGTLSSCRDKPGSMRLVSYMTLWHVELSHIQFL